MKKIICLIIFYFIFLHIVFAYDTITESQYTSSDSFYFDTYFIVSSSSYCPADSFFLGDTYDLITSTEYTSSDSFVFNFISNNQTTSNKNKNYIVLNNKLNFYRRFR